MISDTSQRVQELNDSTQIDISECVQATTDRQRRRCQLLKASRYLRCNRPGGLLPLAPTRQFKAVHPSFAPFLALRQTRWPPQKPPNSAWLSGKKAFSK